MMNSLSGGSEKVERQKKAARVRSKPWLYVGPHLLFFGIFGLIPLIYGIYISFTQWDMTGDAVFVGLQNYKEILFNADSTFHSQFTDGLRNTLIYVVISVPLLILVPLLIAMALNTKVKGAGLFQSLFYIPGLFSISAIALIWTLVFNKRVGPINNLFGSAVNWITTQPYAWLVILIVSVWWGIGGNMVIYRAALNGIPQELYEAADIDGASSVKKFVYITIPSIKFQLLYTFVMTTIASFNIYGQPVMLTNGGPTQSTTVLMMHIRNLAFGKGQSVAGMASAMAVLLGLIMVVISAIQFMWLNKDSSKG